VTASLDWAEYAARQFEPQRRRFATPGDLARHCDPIVRQTPALDALDRVLAAMAGGAVDKQMVFMAPQVGKSERAVRRNVAYRLERDPKLRIVVASFDYSTARRWGAAVKMDVAAAPDLGIRLRDDSKAAGYWLTEQGGSLYCVGIRGALTSRAVDLLIIDDPVKDRAAAESQMQRDAAWDWWENVAKPRSTQVLVIQTRWHADDLAGRMLQREPGEWAVLSIPAIAESDDDPLGRAVGEEMEPARERPAGYYTALQKTTSPYVWASLYQQRPTLAQGNLFRRGDWRYWTSTGPGEVLAESDTAGRPERYMLGDCFRFITMDLASSTKTSADHTVAGAWAITLAGDLVLLDRVRERVPQADHMALLEPLRSRWLTPYDTTYIESRMFGSTLVYALGRKGLPVAELEADTDKLTRALAAADLVRHHRVLLPRKAAWLDEWLDEHADFPNGRFDDQVDVMAYAARVALTRWLAPQTAAEEQAARPVRDPNDVDLMTAAW
jgi:predicted phage terminase large subunit-like protein